MEVINKMGTISESAKNFEPNRMKNIADLEVVRTDVKFIENESRTDQSGEEYKVSYFTQEGFEYRTPASVLEQLQAILKSKPGLKTFKVDKKGEGKGTKYQVIALD